MSTKPLTQREREVAAVTRDLLLKGTPYTRIAKYCLSRNMTEDQIRRFCEKIQELGVSITGEVMHAVWEIECQQDDLSVCFGKRLSHRLNEK